MTRKESLPEIREDPNTPLLEKLRRLPGWETNDYWREKDRKEGGLYVWLNDPSGNILLEYHQSGTYFNLEAGAWGTSTDVNLYDENGICFQVIEIVTGTDSSARVKYDVVAPPFEEKYWDPEWFGIHYGPDGHMDPLRNIKGMPRRINTLETVTAFVQQLMEGNFDQPRLIRW